MKEYCMSNDPYHMNWVAGSKEWGTVRCPEGIAYKVESTRKGDVVRERYTFTNTSKRDVFLSLTDIAIYTPFQDDYPDAATCITN